MRSTAVRRLAVTAAASTVLLTGLAACGSGGDSSTTTSGGGDQDPSATVVQGVPTLETLYQGTGGQPPSTSPPPAAGKSVWWVSCGQSIPACAAVADGARQAAEALGWDFHIADGNSNQGGAWATSYRTAVAAKADAIVNMGIDCPDIQQPLLEAKAAGIPTMAYQSLDCSVTGGPSLFSIPMAYSRMR